MDRRFLSSSATTLLLLLLSHAAAVSSATPVTIPPPSFSPPRPSPLRRNTDQCVYTIYVQTGSIIKGGTDSRIGLTLGDAAGRSIIIPDLVPWGGLAARGRDYYERGALDAFSGRGPCGLSGPLCRLNVTSDGAGRHHGWFCEYVEVTATGPHVPCKQTLFHVRQWLATDAPPFQLYAAVDGCGEDGGGGRGDRFVVGERRSGSGSGSSVRSGS